MSVKEAIVLGPIVLALMIGTWALIGPEGRCDAHQTFNEARDKVMGRDFTPRVMSKDCLLAGVSGRSGGKRRNDTSAAP